MKDIIEGGDAEQEGTKSEIPPEDIPAVTPNPEDSNKDAPIEPVLGSKPPTPRPSQPPVASSVKEVVVVKKVFHDPTPLNFNVPFPHVITMA